MTLQTHHRQLIAWQRAMDLVTESYAVAKRLPAAERYGLASQIRRAAVSIPANIAEGYGRVHRGDYVRHLSIARGSAAELGTLLEIGVRLGYFEPHELVAVLERVNHVVLRLR